MSASTLPEINVRPVAVAVPLDEGASLATDGNRRSDLYLDIFERVLVGGFFCWLMARMVADYLNEGNLGSLVLLPSEGLVAVFIAIRRRSRSMSRSLVAWLLALGATCVPLLVAPAGDEALIPIGVGAVFMLMGLLVQVHAKISLGRSMGCVAAHRGLSLAGPYRFVRHPMYAGYLLGHLAFLALNPSLWNLLVYGICYAMQIPRLVLEERLLSQDPCYREYQTRVPSRLIPGIF